MTATMSTGITPYDFVQQVYYMQEKTLLDFYPADDKYREVLVEANLVLRELESQQDWTWLREKLILGEVNQNYGEIVQFKIPADQDIYKLSMLNHDCIRVYPIIGMDGSEYILDETTFIALPIASAGDQRWNREKQVNIFGVNHVHDNQLRAVVHGDTILFNRMILPWENAVAVVDVQKHIKQFHVCDESCLDNHYNCTSGDTDILERLTKLCTRAETKYLTEVPDPNYVIMATAARHAEGSPPALARVAGLQDAAQRILSQMRQNDSDATDSDYIEWDLPGYIEVI